MRIQRPSPSTPIRRTVHRLASNSKRAHTLVLLGLIALATTALGSTAASADSLRQLILGLGSTNAGGVSQPSQPEAALHSPLLTAAILQSSTALAVERRGHTATMLGDGRVLIVGGENTGGLISQCEIFDPTAGTFSVGGNLSSARTDHSATRLADGRVLIAGGSGTAGALTTTEIFDPTTGTFASGPAIGVARAGHSATLFADGQVLIAGGNSNGTAELLDVAAGSSTAVGAMSSARSGHSAALMLDGRVLIVGGRDADGNELSSGEIFDTPAGSFSAVDGTLKVARVRAHLRVLFDGKVQIIGGSTDGSMEIYDPLIEEFGAYAHVLPESDTCVGLSGQILTSQTRAALFHNGQSDPLFDRSGHTITEMNGQALVLGGANSSGTVLNSSSVVASSSASITTDKMDYAPGETATITGRGFQPGETVRLKIHEDPHTPQERGFDAVADANGHFSGEYAVQDHDIALKFIVGARGLTSGWTAQTTFTDARNWILTFGGTGSGTVKVTPSTGTVNAPVSCGGTGTNAATQTVASTCLPNITTSANGASVTFLATANVGSTFGGWSGQADLSSSTCTGTTNPCSAVIGPSGTITVTFNGPVNVATTLTLAAPSPASVQFGSSGPVTLSATLTRTSGGAAVVGATVNFTVDSSPVGSAVTNGSGVASITTYNPSALAVGGHTVQASFSQQTISGTTYAASTSGTQTLTVTKADQTITFGALANKTYGDADFGVSATASSGLAVSFSSQTLSTCTVSGSTVHIVAAGICTIRASQAGDANYNAAPNVDQSFTVNPKTLTASIVGNPTKPYDGNANAALTSANFSLSGLVGSDSFTVTKTTGTYNSADVSSATTVTTSLVAGDFTPGAGTSASNYNLPTTASGAGQITKANATVVVTPYNVTYDGQPHSATYTITGVNGETGATVGTVDVSGTTHTNAGSYPGDPWTFTGTANYNNSNGTVDDNIDKANATFTVTPYNVTYDGFAHTATVSTITGVNGETGATVGTVDVSGTTHTNAGSYPGDPWTFTGTANYNNSNGTVDDNIDKANATFTVTPYNVTYDGFAHTATVSTITGVNGETGATVGTVDVSGTTHTNAGSYPGDPWTFTGTANYNNSNGTVDDNIDKANATFTVTPYNVTYDGFAHTATVSTITGVNGETGATVGTVDVSGTTHTNAGSYPGDPWTFTGTANYNNSNGTVDDNIDKANATFTVTPYNVTYDGFAHTATVSTITGVNGETGATVGTVDVSGTTHTNAGSYPGDPWTFTGTANYNNSNGTVDDNIDKANATFTVTPYNVTYDGFAHTATVSTITGVNGETGATVGTVDVSGTTHTNAGSYPGDPWTFTGTANYNNSNGTVDDNIDKANATFTVTPYNVTYDGFAHTATVSTITGVNGETGATVGTVDVSGTTHTNAGSYPGDPWTFTGTANYNNSNGTVDDNIDKANATFTVTPYNVTYDGFAHTATVSTITGVNGETGATVGTVDVSGTTHTNAGSYPGDPWTFTGTANYNNSNGTVDDNIDKANATFTVTPYNVTYDGFAHTATVSTITGVNGETGATVGTVDVSGTTHTNAGSYPGDPWTFTGTANYNNSNGTVDDNIDKANATFTVTPYNVTYDGFAHTATVSTITGVNGETGATVGTVDVSGTTHTNAGSYPGDPWTFTGTANYNNSNGTVDDNIDKANATFTVTPYNVTYDGFAHTATVSTITGVNGETGATVGTVDVNGTTHTNAGSYPGDPWTFTGTANYNNSNGTVDDNIDKRNTSTTVTASPNPSNCGDAITITATVLGTGSGAGNPSGGSVQFKIDGANFGAPVAVVANQATTTTSTLTAGDHTVQAVFTSADTNFNDSTSTEITATVYCPDIVVTKTADLSSVSAGDQAAYTILVKNEGLGIARNVTLTDSLPAGVVWSTSSAGCAVSGGTSLTCSYGDLNSGDSRTVNVIGTTDAADCGSLNNTAMASATNEASDTQSNDSSSASITVLCPDISVNKTADSSSISSGDPAAYTIMVKNEGLGIARGVTLTDTLPAGVVWSTSSAGCAVSGGTSLSCSFGDLNSGDSRTVNVSGTTDAADCGSLNNTALASATNEATGVLVNNSSSASITVLCPDVVVSKTADASPVDAGNAIGFNITISNTGLGLAKGVALTDTLPSSPGMVWTIDIANSDSGCTITGGNSLSCSFGNLANGAMKKVHVTSPTTPANCGGVSNTATATATNERTSDTFNNSSTASIILNDATAPTITLNANTITLWSPNHKYNTVRVADLVASAADSCSTTLGLSAVYISKVTSDEPENINSGDGNTFKDMVIANDCKSVDLRAERDGSKNGRVYTITFKVKDVAGNVGTMTTKVTVPHSQGPKGVAVDDGPVYTVTNPNCP